MTQNHSASTYPIIDVQCVDTSNLGIREVKVVAVQVSSHSFVVVTLRNDSDTALSRPS